MRIEDMSGRDIAANVWREFGSNVAFFGAITAVLAWLAPSKLSTIGFWVLVVLFGLNALHVAIGVVIPGIVVVVLAAREGRFDWRDEAWLSLATLLRLGEVAFDIACVLFLWADLK